MASADNNPSRTEKSVSNVDGNITVPEENERNSGVLSTLGVRVIQTVIFMYDFIMLASLTLPKRCLVFFAPFVI